MTWIIVKFNRAQAFLTTLSSLAAAPPLLPAAKPLTPP